MKLNKNCPVYVFDTCALLDFALKRTANHADLLEKLSSHGQYYYHPISLSEIATYLHEKVWQIVDKKATQAQNKQRIKKRQHLLALLYAHRKHDNPGEYLYGRRFLPCHTTFEMFRRMAHQRSQPQNLHQLNNKRCVVVSTIIDHQILTAAESLKHSKFDVTFISSDQDLLATAAHLGVPWVDSKNPHRTTPFAWRGCV